MWQDLKGTVNMAVIVAALGYFVDIYDLVLFGVVRVPSLVGIGVPEDMILDTGVYLLNMQMIGMLIGGIIWGIWGDKRGRVSVLFGSILLYSVANILNAFVTSVDQYAILRFLAGVGLAGELGAGITLVSEVIPKEKRGYSTAIVAAIGVSGAIVAGFVAKMMDWQTAYIVGGLLGLVLLALRFKVFESGMFAKSVADKTVKRGSFLMLFGSWQRLSKYLACILIGVPIWYVVAILVMFSPELAAALGATGPVEAGTAVMLCYLGLVFGDLASGFMSQLIKSRRNVVKIFLGLTACLVAIYLLVPGQSPLWFYGLSLFLGFATGYWAVFVTIGAEQFGTNIRATVTTTVPNFVRGAVVPITLLFSVFKQSFTLVESAALVGAICLALAALALWRLKETYGKDLDYMEK